MIDDLEDISDGFARAFAEIAQCRLQDQHALTFPLLAILLQGIGDYAMALDSDKAASVLSLKLTDSAMAAVLESAELVKDKFKSIVTPTYTAVSYWSPVDRRRHTIAHRTQPRSEMEKRQCLTHACAFYDLTLNGPPQYYSVVHYVAERAARKLPLNVCYQRNLPSCGITNWWHIPPDLVEGILDATFVRPSIEDKINQFGRREEGVLDEALRSMLENSEGREARSWDFANPVIQGFESRLRGMPSLLRTKIEKQARYLNDTLSLAGSPAEDVSFSQAAFMLMTHAIYKEACPAEFLYMFPVRVPGTCCVMHIGTNEPLATESHLALAAFTRSLFYQPLLLEYSAIECKSLLEVEESKARLEVALTMGHSFGGEIRAAETALDSLQRTVPPDAIDKIRPYLTDLATAIEKMKQIKYSMKKLVPYALTNPQPCAVYGILSEIAGDARDIGFVCVLSGDSGLKVLGEHDALIECFGELLHNADRWVGQGAARCLNLSVARLAPTDLPGELNPFRKYLRIEFHDNGPGIPLLQREEIFQAYVTRHPKGMGLGLSEVRRKIAAHEGIIRVTDVLGAGACFEIILPISN